MDATSVINLKDISATSKLSTATLSTEPHYVIKIPTYKTVRGDAEYVRTSYLGRFNTLEDLRDSGAHKIFSQKEIINFNTQSFDENINIAYAPKYEAQLLKEEDEIETMYFNHFIKVYPIVDEAVDKNVVVGTTKLYCDNFELIQYGDSIPYIVSYDRKGVEGKDVLGAEGLEDLDCSIFAKIVSYNPQTHLITVNNTIWFDNVNTPKYVVVAYQHLSPFMRPQSLTIITPNDGIKNTIAPLIEEFKNGLCNIELYSKDEFELLEEDKSYLKKKDVWNIKIKNLKSQLEKSPEYYGSGVWGVYNKKVLDNNDLKIKLNIATETGCTYSPMYGTLVTSGANYLIIKPKTKGNLFQTAINVNDTVHHVNYPLSANAYCSISPQDVGKNAITALTLNGMNMQGNIYGLFSDMANLEMVRNFKLSNVNAYRQMFVNCPNLIYIGNDSSSLEGSVSCNAADLQYFDLYSGLGNIENIDTSNLEYYIQNDVDSVIRVSMKNAFKDCKSLKKLTLKFKGNNTIAVTSLESAFEGCERLEVIDLSNFDLSLLKTAKNAFKGCKRLKTIIVNKQYYNTGKHEDNKWGINNVIESINGVFEDCKMLTEAGVFQIANTNVDIQNAYKNCLSINEVELSVDTNIIKDVFYNCGAQKISFTFKKENNGNVNTNWTSLIMPNLTTIEKCGSIIGEINCANNANYAPLLLNLPQLDRINWLKFVEKQNFDYYTDNDIVVLKVHSNIISKLIKDTDIVEVDDYYVLANNNNVKILVGEW